MFPFEMLGLGHAGLGQTLSRLSSAVPSCPESHACLLSLHWGLMLFSHDMDRWEATGQNSL